LELLLDGINDIISKNDEAKKDSNSSPDREAFNSELASLKDALETLDAGAMNQSIDILRRLAQGKSIKDDVKSISEKILVAEFDEAISLIESLLQN